MEVLIRFSWRFLLFFLSGLGLAGCSVSLGPVDPKDVANTKPVSLAFDGVKWISPDVTRMNDEVALLQSRYPISSNGRLLLRYEGLSGYKDQALLEHPILVKVNLMEAADVSRAEENLQLCPLTQTWMMGATWVKAHPYTGGDWQDGGPMDWSACMKAVLPADREFWNEGEKHFCAGPEAICFDVRSWYESYILERGTNYGMALVYESIQPVMIFGDGSMARGPEIFWRSLR